MLKEEKVFKKSTNLRFLDEEEEEELELELENRNPFPGLSSTPAHPSGAARGGIKMQGKMSVEELW